MIIGSRFILTASCFCLLLANVAFANPNQADTGRLADGRAYRIDSEGYRITDQLAELEVANDDLRKQIIALENELDEKNRSLTRIDQGGATSKQAVKEVSLINQAPVQQNNFQLQALEQRVSALSNELLQIKSERDSCIQLAQTGTNNENAELKMAQARLNELAEALSQEQSRSQSLRAQLETLALRVNEFDSVERQRVASVAQEREQQQVKLAKPAQTTSRARIGESIDRNELNRKLSKIQQLVLERKTLFDQAKQRRESVGVSLATLRTNSGISLDALRASAKSADSDLQLHQASLGLTEIQQILTEDIQLLTRLAKGRS